MSSAQRRTLERIAAEGGERHSVRARIILCRAEGFSQEETARKLGCSSKRVSRWTARFRRMGLGALEELGGLDELSPRRNEVEAPAGMRMGENLAEPVTIRAVARIAKVSPMTVSRVLNNHANVSTEVRSRILEILDRTGYRSDPELRKLMAHLRKRRVRHLRGSICSLEASSWAPEGGHYFRTLVAGARAGAEALGYSWSSFILEEVLEKPETFLRICYNRGVDGIFIAPAPHTLRNHRLSAHVNWNRFSILAATYSIQSPTFHRVVPNHFKNMTLLCESLLGLGYHRIGLAIPENLDKRLFHHLSGSYLAFHHEKKLEAAPILLYPNPRNVAELRDWFKRVKPDALIVNSGMNGLKIAEELKLTIPGTVAIAALALPDGLTAGIDELPGQIGIIAAERLGSMMVHRQTGLPDLPTVIMVDGVWRDGESAQPRVGGR